MRLRDAQPRKAVKLTGEEVGMLSGLAVAGAFVSRLVAQKDFS